MYRQLISGRRIDHSVLGVGRIVDVDENFGIRIFISFDQDNDGSKPRKFSTHVFEKFNNFDIFQALANVIYHNNILNQFFERNDFDSAERYVSSNNDNVVTQLFENKKREAIENIWQEVINALDLFWFTRADSQLALIKRYLSVEKLEEFQWRSTSRRQAFVNEHVLMITEALSNYDYVRANSFLQIAPFYHKEEFSV